MYYKSIPSLADAINANYEEADIEFSKCICFFNKLDRNLKNKTVTDLLLELIRNSFNKAACNAIKLFSL